MTRCKLCGTNGDHYCPADVPLGDDKYCANCDHILRYDPVENADNRYFCDDRCKEEFYAN